VGDMQIKLDLKIFIFIIIFVLTRQIEIYGMLMLFAFLHELGHLLAGLLLGFKPKSLKINPLGLSISFWVKSEDYNRRIFCGNILAVKKLLIASAGPIVNFVLVIFFSINNLEFINIDKEILVYSNILIGLFNLIPIYPLDGGRILKNLLYILTGLKNTYMYINIVSYISIIILTFFSSIMIVYLENISVLFIIGYLWYLVIAENRAYKQRNRIYDVLTEGQNL
jgi:stage IV sporulation protein FB